VRLYHETARENIASILAEGFRDGGPEPYAPGHNYAVYVADKPPRFRSGPSWALLAIDADLSETELARYAYNRRAWSVNPYREWRVPAQVLNRFPRREIRR